MTSLALNSLKYSIKFDINFQIVKSWWEHMKFKTENEAETFFSENIEMIKARPFVKWVGGKFYIL